MRCAESLFGPYVLMQTGTSGVGVVFGWCWRVVIFFNGGLSSEWMAWWNGSLSLILCCSESRISFFTLWDASERYHPHEFYPPCSRSWRMLLTLFVGIKVKIVHKLNRLEVVEHLTWILVMISSIDKYHITLSVLCIHCFVGPWLAGLVIRPVQTVT